MDQSLKLRFRPVWEEIERIVTELSGFVRQYEFTPEQLNTFVMIVTELVENALKYGQDSSSGDDFCVSLEMQEHSLLVEVTNPIDDTASNHLQRLDHMVQWIRGYQDPFEAYIHRLKEVAKKSLSDPESGLGLARIAYEGGAILDFFVNDEDVLNVSATTSFE